jgi:hypothetical protein
LPDLLDEPFAEPLRGLGVFAEVLDFGVAGFRRGMSFLSDWDESIL